jgi:DNA-binding MarR family transcriptional regulator
MNTLFDDISEPLSRRVGGGLAKIAMVMRHQAWAQGGAHGLTPTQAQVLTLLRGRGALRLSAIADELAITAPTASDAVAALQRKALVEKQRAAEDRRAVAISLTPTGGEAASGLTEWPDVLRTAIEDLSPDEQALLLKMLTKMIRTLQVQRAIPVQRMCVGCRHFRPNVHDDTDAPHHCAFVDAAFGNRHLRLDCDDFEAADAAISAANWRQFLSPHRSQENEK